MSERKEYFEDRAMFCRGVNVKVDINFLHNLQARLADCLYDGYKNDINIIESWIAILSGKTRTIGHFFPNTIIADMLDRIGYTEAAKSWRHPTLEDQDPLGLNPVVATIQVAANQETTNVIVSPEIYKEYSGPARNLFSESRIPTLLSHPIPKDCDNTK